MLSVQTNKKYWGDDAHLFKPDRFEPEAFKKVPSYAYIPFTGRQNIISGFICSWRQKILNSISFLKFIQIVNLTQHLNYPGIFIAFKPFNSLFRWTSDMHRLAVRNVFCENRHCKYSSKLQTVNNAKVWRDWMRDDSLNENCARLHDEPRKKIVVTGISFSTSVNQEKKLV